MWSGPAYAVPLQFLTVCVYDVFTLIMPPKRFSFQQWLLKKIRTIQIQCSQTDIVLNCNVVSDHDRQNDLKTGYGYIQRGRVDYL